MLGEAGVAARARNFLVSTGLVEAADVAVAGHASLRVNFFRSRVNGGSKRHRHCKCYAGLNEIVFCHLVSPYRDFSCLVWNRNALGVASACKSRLTDFLTEKNTVNSASFFPN